MKASKEVIKKATDGRMMNYAKLLTTLQRVDNRPICVRSLDDKVVVSVTPNMLFLGTVP